MSKWCVNAAASCRTNNNGYCMICCMSNQLLETNGRKVNIETHSLSKIFNSDTRKEVDEALRNGIEHPNCQKCWDEERAGFKSKRQRDNENYSYIKEHQSYSMPKFMEFNLGNVCNIKCRTCGPWSSSKWLNDHMALNPKDHKSQYSKLMNIYKDELPFWQELIDNLPNMRYLDFYGGEPFLVKRQWELLQSAIASGDAKHIGVHYNTNGTLWDEDKVKFLNEFESVKIDFSIDGINDRFEYMRHPAKWDVVQSNLFKAKELFNDKQIAICHTVSVSNVYYIDEMLNWCYDNNFHMYLNLVHKKLRDNISILPDEIKKKIKEKIWNNLNPDLLKEDCWANYFINSLDSVMKFMESGQYNEAEFADFFKTTHSLDLIRNESFYRTFPEYYTIIERYDNLLRR